MIKGIIKWFSSLFSHKDGEKERLRHELSGCIKEIYALRAGNQRLQEDAANTAKVINRLNAENTELRSRNAELKASLSAANGQISRQLKEMESQKSEIQLLIGQMRQSGGGEETKMAKSGDRRIARDLIKAIRNCDMLRCSETISEPAYSYITSDLEKMLNSLGVYSVNGSAGAFDAGFQKVVEVKSTDDPAKDGMISQSLLRGFRQGDECIDPEEVEIYKYERK